MFISIGQARSFLDKQSGGFPEDVSRVRKACQEVYGSCKRLSDKQWGRWLERVEASESEFESGCLEYSTCVLLKIMAMELSGNQHRKVLRRCSSACLLIRLAEYAMAGQCNTLWPAEGVDVSTGREIYQEIKQITGHSYDREYLRRRIGLRMREKYTDQEKRQLIESLLPSKAA